MIGEWDGVPTRRWTPPRARTVVVVPHPDDEALGAGGLIATQRLAGVPVVVVAVTDGEAAYPDPMGREELAARRRIEQAAAVAVLGVAPHEVVRLGWPDGAIADHEAELASQLTALIRPDDLVVAPWPGDHHPDHEACGRAAALAAAARGADRVGSLVWAPVRVPVDRAPGELLVLHLDAEAADRRRRAVLAHHSQLVAGGARAPVVGGELLARLDRPVELFVDSEATVDDGDVDRASPAFFEALYRADPDPWSFASDDAETARYEALLDLLGPGPLGEVLEPGCSIGVLTARLAERSSRVIAFDVAPSAVETARARCQGLDHVDLHVGGLPEDVPLRPVDVVVWSEVGYYFSPAVLDEVVDRLVGALRPGGRLVACHWRGRSPDHARTGDEVHARIGEHPDLLPVETRAHPTFVLDEWRRR